MKQLLEGNKRFVRDVFEKNRNLFENLALMQAPKAMWFGCSDSRVVPELITMSSPGTIFSKRLLANVIPKNDSAVGGALEHAIGDLGIKHIVVCGHYGCGGIKALDEERKGHLEKFLENAVEAKDAVDGAVRKSGLRVMEGDRHKMIVEANVLLQVRNLESYDVVRKALKKRSLEVQGLVYDIATGELLESPTALNEYGLYDEVRKKIGV